MEIILILSIPMAWYLSGLLADGYILRKKYKELQKEYDETWNELNQYINYIGDEFNRVREEGTLDG